MPFVATAVHSPTDEDDSFRLREDTESARGPGWYEATCALDLGDEPCPWQTTGTENVAEDAAREHFRQAHDGTPASVRPATPTTVVSEPATAGPFPWTVTVTVRPTLRMGRGGVTPTLADDRASLDRVFPDARVRVSDYATYEVVVTTLAHDLASAVADVCRKVEELVGEPTTVSGRRI